MFNEDTLKEKIDSNDLSWFSKGGNRSRIKRFLKSTQLDDNLLIYFWKIRELRYDLISNQKLPKSIVLDIISQVNKKKRNITKSMYIECLLKQNIDDDIFSSIISQSIDLYFIAWETIPRTMFLYDNFDDFLKSVCGMNNDFWSYQTERIKAVVSIIRSIPKESERVIKFICLQPPMVSFEFLNTLSKVTFFKDETIKYMKKNIDLQTYFFIMEHIISRNNCSINQKALFLLEK